jgi:hypothetical protein
LGRTPTGFFFKSELLTIRLRWPHYYTVWLLYMTLESKLCFKKISTTCLNKQLINIYKARYKYFKSGITIIHFHLQKCFHFIFFTLLRFTKPNKTTINKNKTTFLYIDIHVRPFDSRLYLDISCIIHFVIDFQYIWINSHSLRP